MYTMENMISKEQEKQLMQKGIFSLDKISFSLTINCLLNRTPIIILGMDKNNLAEMSSQLINLMSFRKSLLFYTDFITKKEYDLIIENENVNFISKRNIFLCPDSAIFFINRISSFKGWIFNIEETQEKSINEKFEFIIENLLNSNIDSYLLIYAELEEKTGIPVLKIALYDSKRNLIDRKVNFEKKIYEHSVKFTSQQLNIIIKLIKNRLSDPILLEEAGTDFSSMEKEFMSTLLEIYLLEFYNAAQRLIILENLSEKLKIENLKEKQKMKITGSSLAEFSRFEDFVTFEWGNLKSYEDLFNMQTKEENNPWKITPFNLSRENFVYILHFLLYRKPILIIGTEQDDIDLFGKYIAELLTFREIYTYTDEMTSDDIEIIFANEEEGYDIKRSLFFCDSNYSDHLLKITNDFSSFVICAKFDSNEKKKSYLHEFSEILRQTDENTFLFVHQNEKKEIIATPYSIGENSEDKFDPLVLNNSLILENYIYNQIIPTVEKSVELIQMTLKEDYINATKAFGINLNWYFEKVRELFAESIFKIKINEFHNATKRIFALGVNLRLLNLIDIDLDENQENDIDFKDKKIPKLSFGSKTLTEAAHYDHVPLKVILDFIIIEYKEVIRIGEGDTYNDRISAML